MDRHVLVAFRLVKASAACTNDVGVLEQLNFTLDEHWGRKLKCVEFIHTVINHRRCIQMS